VDRASAFLSAAELIPFLDSEKSDSLHIGNDPNREKSAIRKRRSTKRDAAVEGVKRLRDERRAEAAAQKRLREEAQKRLQLREVIQFWTSSFVLRSVQDQPSPLIIGNGVSGYKGVTKSGEKWQVKIIIDKDKWGDSIAKCLGSFGSPEEAAGIYIRAEFHFK
jgi:hypothetical protein